MRYTLILLTLVLVACGPDGKHIAIDGRLLNLNQGEFLVYSPDGATTGVDTIDVAGGRFNFSTECEREGTVVILMAGGQEIPVFVKPGNGYTIKGDAQNLKELEVKGGDNNKLMNTFRKAIAQKTKGEIPVAEIKRLVEENPASPVAMYLVGRQEVILPYLPLAEWHTRVLYHKRIRQHPHGIRGQGRYHIARLREPWRHPLPGYGLLTLNILKARHHAHGS